MYCTRGTYSWRVVQSCMHDFKCQWTTHQITLWCKAIENCHLRKRVEYQDDEWFRFISSEILSLQLVSKVVNNRSRNHDIGKGKHLHQAIQDFATENKHLKTLFTWFIWFSKELNHTCQQELSVRNEKKWGLVMNVIAWNYPWNIVFFVFRVETFDDMPDS
jgi:hypothetical protein